MRKTDQLLVLFIPQSQRSRFQTGKQSDRFYFREQRVGFVAPLQIVVRYPRAQMMDVMKADVAREPLENL
jgi:hypothetical protein